MSNPPSKNLATRIVGIGKITFLIMFKYIEYDDFLIAIKNPLLIKNIGYAGKIKADIFKYKDPYLITS